MFLGIVWNRGRLDYKEHSNIVPREIKTDFSAKGTEKCQLLASSLDMEVENLDNYGCHKVQDLVDEEMWISSSYPFRPKTTRHGVECKAKLFGN